MNWLLESSPSIDKKCHQVVGILPIAWSRLPARRIPLWPFVSLWFATNIFGYFYHNSEKRGYWRDGKLKKKFFLKY